METMEATIERLQTTIDELNAKTAANDVTIADLEHRLVMARHELDVRVERELETIRQTADRHAAEIERLRADAAAQVGRWSALYQTQDALVRALEAHAPDDVKAAMESFRRAELAVQLEQLRARVGA